jgi:hypothetical protein
MYAGQLYFLQRVELDHHKHWIEVWTGCAILDRMCNFGQDMQFWTGCAILDRMCNFVQDVQFCTGCEIWTGCASLDRVCNFGQDVQFCTGCASLDRVCNFGQGVQVSVCYLSVARGNYVCDACVASGCITNTSCITPQKNRPQLQLGGILISCMCCTPLARW